MAKRKKQVSNMPRAMKFLRDDGYLCESVERWNSFTHTRHDLFGFADLIACNPDRCIIALIQLTTGDHHAERVNKIRGKCWENASKWLESGGHIWVWSYRKGASGRYILRQEQIT